MHSDNNGQYMPMYSDMEYDILGLHLDIML